MACIYGFGLEEAKEAGICFECTQDSCRMHPKYNEWRATQGLRSLQPNTGTCTTEIPELVSTQIEGDLVGGVLLTMAKSAKFIFKQEGMHDWEVFVKRNVWATYCRYHPSRGQKFVQFGEKCALLHAGLLKGFDTVKRDCQRFGWKYDRANGCAMIVIHEVAHAAEAHRGLKMSHSHTHKQLMREFRANYLDILVATFDAFFEETQKAHQLLAHAFV